MKELLHAFAMTQSMFCAIPCPWKLWDEKARGKILLFLPLVGLEIGGLWYGLWYLTCFLGLPNLLRGLLTAVLPFVATGFIHLDGFMDVTDAVKSCRSLERRREILKDPHVGSFAVIGCCLLLLTQFALAASLEDSPGLVILILVPVVSRCCSALAVTSLRPMSTSQYAAQEKHKSHLLILGLLLAVTLAAGFLLWGRYGWVLIGCLGGYGLALHRGRSSLDGMNGDIAGYALTLGELCALAVCVLIPRF